MTRAWKFEENTGGEKEGFNASGISMFAGDTVESLTREVIQNSLDARDDKTKPVEIRFEVLKVDKSTAPEIYALGEWIDRGYDAEKHQDMNSAVGIDFYEAARNYLNADAGLPLLAIHDSNTIGLGGPLRTSRLEKDGSWISLVASSGVTLKQGDDALGSFGQGAKAPFAISGLRTVFYYTKTRNDTPQQSRFQGKSILQSMWLSDHVHTGKTGFFGEEDTEGKVRALIDAEVPDWVRRSRSSFTDENGTSLFVAAPREAEDTDAFWFKMKVAILANFYYAISAGNLEVTFGDSDVFDNKTLSSSFDRLINAQKDNLRGFSDKIQDALESSTTIQAGLGNEDGHGSFHVNEFGEIKWFIRFGDGSSRRTVGVARQNGMLITRRPPKLQRFPSFKPFDLFVCVTGTEGSQVLRSFENPQHNDFEWDRVVDPLVRAKYQKSYEKFADSVRDHLGTMVSAEIKESIKTGDLNHLFGGSVSDISGEEFDESSTRIKISRTQKRKIVAGEKTQIQDDIFEDAGGFGVGNGKIETPGGREPFSEGDSQVPAKKIKGLQVKNLRVSPPDVEGYSQVNFTPTQSGVSTLHLFKSGTSDTAPVEFQLPNSPQWITSVSVPTALSGRRKKIRLRFHELDLQFSMEAVLSDGI